MNEYFKQIFEAWGDRVKTPFIGSILISFIAINWKVIFYLLFADKPVRARLLYFEANTTEISLYVLPLVVGLLAAILLPWASVIGAFLGRYPKARLHGIQHSEVVKRRIYEFEQKASEEEAIAKLEDAREKRKLDAARRINEAEEIGGSVAQEIKEDRRVNIADLKFEKPSISNAEFKLLTFAKKVSDGRFLFRDGLVFAGDPESYDTETFSFGETHRDTLLLSEAIAHLESGDYLLEKKSAYSNSIEYEVTMAGYKLLDAP